MLGLHKQLFIFIKSLTKLMSIAPKICIFMLKMLLKNWNLGAAAEANRTCCIEFLAASAHTLLFIRSKFAMPLKSFELWPNNWESNVFNRGKVGVATSESANFQLPASKSNLASFP